MRSKPIVNCIHNSNQSRICGICWVPLKMKKWIGGEFVWMPLHSKAAYEIRATQIRILIDQVLPISHLWCLQILMIRMKVALPNPC